MKEVVRRRSKLKQIVRSHLFRHRVVGSKKGKGSYRRTERNNSEETST